MHSMEMSRTGKQKYLQLQACDSRPQSLPLQLPAYKKIKHKNFYSNYMSNCETNISHLINDFFKHRIFIHFHFWGGGLIAFICLEKESDIE